MMSNKIPTTCKPTDRKLKVLTTTKFTRTGIDRRRKYRLQYTTRGPLAEDWGWGPLVLTGRKWEGTVRQY